MTHLTTIENPFAFSNSPIRTATDPSGTVWFCAKDVFAALGIEWKGSKGSLTNTPENWQHLWYLQTSNGVKETIFISEAAVYQTSFRSIKPEAQRFVAWVCEEVLPTIRRQGYYGTLPAANQVGARKVLLSTLTQLKSSRDAFEIALLTNQVRELCNQLGTSMPALSLLGQDPKQQSIPGV